MKRKLLFLGAVLSSGAILWQKTKHTSPNTLHNKVVIVTGASSGIGRAAAEVFCEAGAWVVLVARRQNLLQDLEAELSHYGQPILSVPTDLTNDEQIDHLVATVMQKFGRIDVLVNNAGLSMGGPLAELDVVAIHQMIEVNVYGPIRLTHAVLPIMLKQKEGHIVNVSSVAGLIATPGQAAYGATRAAIISFSDALRRELDGGNIHVSCIHPGWTKTAMLDKISQPELMEAGLLNPLMTLDEADVPARAIVEAVRYNQPRVVLGGLQMVGGAFLSRLSPDLADLLFRVVFRFNDKDRFLQVLKQLGV